MKTPLLGACTLAWALFLTGCDFGLDAPLEDANGIYLDLISSTSITGSRLLVHGAHAYVTVGGTISVFDVSDKFNPVMVNDLSLGEGIKDVSLAGSYIYSVFWDGNYPYTHQLAVIDVSSPSLLKTVAKMDLQRAATGINVDGSYAYIRAGRSLLVIDISSPGNPLLAETIDFRRDLVDHVVENGTAYLLSRFGLVTYDLSDPGSPSKSSESSFWGSTRMAKDRDYLYIALSGEYSFHPSIEVIRIEESEDPDFVRSVRFPREITGFDFDEYGVANDNSTLYLLNMDNPSFPCVAERMMSDGKSVVIQGDYLYVLGKDYLTIIKVQEIR